MSKPESIKIEPWTDFPRQAYSIITDDFVHDKLACVKVNAKGERSTANIKASVNVDKGTTSLSDEVKLWFQLPGGKSIYSKLKSSNYVKVHYDNGRTRLMDKDWNFYASFNANKSLENMSVRVGATHLGGKCHSDNRIKYDRQNYTWYNRTLVNHNKFSFGLLGAYGFANNVLVKNNLFLGYQVDENSSLFLRMENDGYRSSAFNGGDWKNYFDHVKVDWVSKYQGVKYGVEVRVG